MKAGESIPRLEGMSKATGREKYAADHYSSDFVWTGVKRAGIPHGRLLKIHTEQARALPGVINVLTWNDVPGHNRQGVVKQDQPVLVDKKIRHSGDALALVLADNKSSLKKAIDLITFDAAPLPGVFDMDEALGNEAALVHEDSPTGNLLRHVPITKGRGEDGFDECDVIVDFSCETPRQEHAFLETQAGWAYIDRDGTTVVVASTQTPFRDAREIAYALGLESDRIRVVAPYLGGAFGGKDGLTVQAFLALALLHSGGRPVKMWWDREESFAAGVKRIAARMEYRLGAKADGTMTALKCRLCFDSGPYASLSGEIMTLAVEHAGGAYRIPHVRIDGLAVYTNNPMGGPFRGFGVPQATAAMEQTVDVLADRLGMDPLALRLRNVLKPGDENCIGVAMVYSTAAHECLSRLGEHPLWKEREVWTRGAGPFKRRGVGITCVSHAMGYPKIVPDQAGAKIEVTPEDTVRVYCGVSDMGQGNGSTYLQMAGHIFDQDEAHLELVLPDTGRTLPGGSASASRCTYVYGNALVEAASLLKERIIEKASLLLDVPPRELALGPGCVSHEPSGRSLSLGRIAEALGDERFVEHFYRAPVAGESSDLIYMGPHVLYSFGAHLAYVEVDGLTGAVEVKEYLTVTDAGRLVNPQSFEQQMQGSVAQGLGYALTESFVLDKGRVLSANLATYTIPTALDVPDMISLALDVAEETGPFGMKGAGEIGISGPFPVIANGVARALGERTSLGPYGSERCLGVISRKARNRGGSGE
jgi:CO/xanthine dehydrogenase Mo-binding subunit